MFLFLLNLINYLFWNVQSRKKNQWKFFFIGWYVIEEDCTLKKVSKFKKRNNFNKNQSYCVYLSKLSKNVFFERNRIHILIENRLYSFWGLKVSLVYKRVVWKICKGTIKTCVSGLMLDYKTPNKKPQNFFSIHKIKECKSYCEI